jgi:hypothetical protein
MGTYHGVRPGVPKTAVDEQVSEVPISSIGQQRWVREMSRVVGSVSKIWKFLLTIFTAERL